MKRNPEKPVFSASGGRVLSERDSVDYVLFMPGDHFEIVEDEAYADAEREERLLHEPTRITRSPLHPSHWLQDDEDDDEYDYAYPEAAETEPEPALEDDDITMVTQPRASWWEAAKQGVRAISTERPWWQAARNGLRAVSDE